MTNPSHLYDPPAVSCRFQQADQPDRAAIHTTILALARYEEQQNA